MKKWLSIGILSLCFIVPLHSQNTSEKSTFSFYLQPEMAVTAGKMDKYLYNSNNNRIISHLQWEEKPVVYFGGELGFNIDKFSFTANGFHSISDVCGKMYDSDWNVPGVKTNYGIFTNHIDNSWYTDAKLKYEFALTPSYSLAPLFQFKYRYTGFTTDKGIGWYGDSKNSTNGNNESWDSEYAKKYKLSGIDYYTKNLFYYGGIGQKLEVDKLEINLDLLFSPYIYIFTKDYHRDDVAKDDFDSQAYYTVTKHKDYFKLYALELSLNYSIKSNIELFISSSVEMLFKTLGPTATNNFNGEHFGMFEDEWMLLKQKSAVDFTEVTVMSGIKINL